MTPPFLAQGMCQGVRDASNLLWKLAAHRHGGAGDPLLDSYQLEREPHVLQVTSTAKEYGRIICERDERATAERDARLLAELAARPGGTVRQSLIPALGAGFLSPGGTPARGEILPQPRVRDAAGRGGLLDDFTGAGFRLALGADTDAEAVTAALREHGSRGGFPVRAVRLDPGGAGPVREGAHREEVPVLAPWLRRHGCAAALARPDHYVYGGVRDAGDGGIGRLLADTRERWTGAAGTPAG